MDTFSPLELRFSEKAILHFAASLKNNGKSDGVRIGVRKAGCSGFEYFFEFVETEQAELMTSFLKKVSARSLLIQKA
jgi:iron-sulfur cluster assembly protein